MSDFHEVRFPLDIALGARGGPERRTQVIATASGREERIARWAHARRKYDAGYGVKSLSKLAEVVAFFEERRGKLYGFRFRDRLDCASAPANAAPGPLDQTIGTGNGSAASFQLIKTYGNAFAPYARPVTKPVAGSVRLGVNGVEKLIGTHADLEAGTGVVTFRPGHIPAAGTTVTAGYLFDVPVRFDTDYLEFDLSAFDAGVIQSIPLIEVRV